MLNCAQIMGRLTADPELKLTENQVSVCSFTVAVEEDYVKSGEQRKCNFIDCVAWKNKADFVAKYFHKGSMIAVDGEIKTRNWEDKNGNKRKTTEIQADNVHFCGDKEKKSADVVKDEIPESKDEIPENYEIPDDADLPF